MSIIISNKQNPYIIMPAERLDTGTAPEAESLITSAIERGESKVVIDFSRTEYISSAGLRVILKTAKLLKPKGGALALCNTNEQIQEALEISGFLGIINLFKSLDDALTSVNI